MLGLDPIIWGFILQKIIQYSVYPVLSATHKLLRLLICRKLPIIIIILPICKEILQYHKDKIILKQNREVMPKSLQILPSLNSYLIPDFFRTPKQVIVTGLVLVATLKQAKEKVPSKHLKTIEKYETRKTI